MPEWKIPGYTELRALGSGGFGDVVLARHDVSGTLVAVKYLRRDLLADPEFAEMFRSEAAVLASLDDPNVVRLYEYIESSAGAAIVMELVDGVSVQEILSRQGVTTAEAALVVLQGSLLGLAAAHQRGVVHRDYKPANVLVNGAGVSKLTDFGIAARAGDRPVPAGTLAYAPPEQFGGAPASPAGDVYAATATFYECLTGHPPFTGDSAERLLYQQLTEPVPLDPVPAPLRPLVTAGLAKDPTARPADAAAFVGELRIVAAGAYGQDWEDRGRSRLGEAALLLAALWPSAVPPALQGTPVEHVNLHHSAQGSRESRHLWHLRHLRHEAHLRHLSRLRLAVAVGAGAAVVAAVAVVAVVTATKGSSRAPSGPSARIAAPVRCASGATVVGSVCMAIPAGYYQSIREPDILSAATASYSGYIYMFTGSAYDDAFEGRNVGGSPDQQLGFGFKGDPLNMNSVQSFEGPDCTGRLKASGTRPFGPSTAEYRDWTVDCAGQRPSILQVWRIPGSKVVLVSEPNTAAEARPIETMVAHAGFIKPTAGTLPPPTQVSPPDGSVFSNYPRATTLTWNAVPGGARYVVQMQACDPAGCDAGSGHSDLSPYCVTVSGTTYSFDFVGAQPGRWRVAALKPDGELGQFSPWWGFTYTN